MTEIPLGGGNVSGGVVRIGETVRRPAGPWTPAVHALLGHLHAAGFHGAPRPLGLDEHGREVLTFIPGPVAWPDNFHLLGPDGRLHRVARLIRDFHDAVTGFRLSCRRQGEPVSGFLSRRLYRLSKLSRRRRVRIRTASFCCPVGQRSLPERMWPQRWVHMMALSGQHESHGRRE